MVDADLAAEGMVGADLAAAEAVVASHDDVELEYDAVEPLNSRTCFLLPMMPQKLRWLSMAK